jgi:hypothetical protein
MQQHGQQKHRSGAGWASARRCSPPLTTRGGWSRCMTMTKPLKPGWFGDLVGGMLVVFGWLHQWVDGVCVAAGWSR